MTVYIFNFKISIIIQFNFVILNYFAPTPLFNYRYNIAQYITTFAICLDLC